MTKMHREDTDNTAVTMRVSAEGIYSVAGQI